MPGFRSWRTARQSDRRVRRPRRSPEAPFPHPPRVRERCVGCRSPWRGQPQSRPPCPRRYLQPPTAELCPAPGISHTGLRKGEEPSVACHASDYGAPNSIQPASGCFLIIPPSQRRSFCAVRLPGYPTVVSNFFCRSWRWIKCPGVSLARSTRVSQTIPPNTPAPHVQNTP